MSLPQYPPNVPTSPLIKMAERGQQNYFFTNAQTIISTAAGTSTTYGANTIIAPITPIVTATQNGSLTGPFVYGIPPCKAIEQFAQDYVVEVDVYTATTGGTVAGTVVILGSLDGVEFYQLATESFTTTGTIFSLAKVGGANAATPGIKVRYLTAAITAYGGAASTQDSMTASFIF